MINFRCDCGHVESVDFVNHPVAYAWAIDCQKCKKIIEEGNAEDWKRYCKEQAA